MTDDKKYRRARTSTQLERDQEARELESLAALRARRAAERKGTVHSAAPQEEIDIDTGRTDLIEAMEANPALQLLLAKSQHNRAAIIESRQQASNLVLEVAGERPPDERFRKIERGVKAAHWIVTAIAIPAITSAVLITKYLVQKGRDEERAMIEREHDHAQIEANAKTIRELSDEVVRLRAQLETQPDPPVKKDTKP